MVSWLRTAWQRMRGGKETVSSDVAHIAALQEAAKKRRAEYAAAQEQSAAGSSPERLASSRKRVQEAEAAYATAMHQWNDKQFRRKTR